MGRLKFGSKESNLYLKMAQDPLVQNRFKSNLLDLGDAIHILVQDNQVHLGDKLPPVVIKVANKFNAGLAAEVLIEGFIVYSYNYWSQIKESNEKFFINDFVKIFGSVPVDKDKIDVIPLMLTGKTKDDKPIVTKEKKDIIWKYLQMMIRQSIMYLHEAMRSHNATAMTVFNMSKTMNCKFTREQLDALIVEYKVKV